MGRPRKQDDEKRQRITITTLHAILEEIDDERGYMTRSEFIHRLLIEWYNDKHPEAKIPIWIPKSEEIKQK